jgi:hypothetical protein
MRPPPGLHRTRTKIELAVAVERNAAIVGRRMLLKIARDLPTLAAFRRFGLTEKVQRVYTNVRLQN